jgi:hypothetical protein
MSCLFTHPCLLIRRGGAHKKARRVLRHGKHWHEAYGCTKPNYSASKVEIYFQTKERKRKKILKKRKKPEIYCPKHFEDIILSPAFVVKFNLLDGTMEEERSTSTTRHAGAACRLRVVG